MYVLFVSIYYDNKYITKYILPILIFMNIAWLIYAAFSSGFYKPENNWTYYIQIILIVYLLFTFKLEYIESRNGILLNPNETWLYLYVISLILWFFFICDFCPNIIYATVLMSYPLFFPLNEFLIHRAFSLYLSVVFGLYFGIMQ